MAGRAPSIRRRVLRLAGIFGAVALALGAVSAVIAVHDGTFQLEGNVAVDPAGPPPFNNAVNDWAGLFTDSNLGQASQTSPTVTTNAPLPAGYQIATFVEDFGTNANGTFNTSDLTTFTTGSKDILDINQWRCVSANNVTNKGDLTNVYATIYENAGERILYFGAEKTEDNGDNNIGLWVLQGPASCAVPASGNGNPFQGTHTPGDLLLVSEFTNGGGVSSIIAYEWVADAGGGIPGINPTPVAVSADCALSVGGGDNLCATTNVGASAGSPTHTPPWTHYSKRFGVNGGLERSTFFEGGIRLSAFPDFANACFSGFLFNTRSSQELTATLYDYAAGTINTCDARISITPNGLNEVSNAHTFTVTVEQKTGATFVPSPGRTVTATLAAGSTGTITGGTCTGGGTTNASGQCTVIVNSTGVGTATVNVTTTFSIGGTTLTRDNIASTPAPQGTGAVNNNVKQWVDGNVSITPSATNKVGDPHTFTITANGLGPVAPTTITITPSVNPAPGTQSTTCATPTLSNGGATATCTVTINSNSVGVFTANASAGFTYTGGPTFNRSTSGNAGPGGSGPATKTYVDARISIVQTGTNQVNGAHTFTVTVEANNGSGWAPASGVTVSSSETGVGAITGGSCGPSGSTNASGQCTVIVNSATPGSSTVNASATVTVGGVPIAVATNGYGAFTVSNVKTWVDARISIVQTGTNQVNAAHTFTVTVEANNGSGWAPAVGVDVLASETGVGAITGGTCDNAGGDTNASGQCTIIVNSATPGSSTVNASATVSVGGLSIAVATNGYGAFTVSNVKTWVDARISIVQTGTNQVNGAHTFTVTVESNNGSGWAPVAGVTVTPSETGVGAITGGTCSTDPTNASGQCTVIVNSATPGSSTVNASATVTVGGVPIAVATNGYGAFTVSNVKSWVDARISIVQSGTNKVGDPHTFTVTVESNDGSGWAPVVGVAVNPSEVGVGTITGGTCDNSAPDTDASGQCTIIVNSAAPGSSTVNASATVSVGGLSIAVATNGSGAFTVSNVKTWVDARISIVQTGTNQVGQAHTFTVTVESNNGSGWAPVENANVLASETGVGAITGGTCDNTGGDTNASGQCTIIVNSATPGSSTVNASSTVSVGGLDIAVATDGYGAFTVSNVKTWVDARISIVQSGTNQVNQAHTFTVTVEQNDGTGWAPAVGVAVNPSETGVGAITGGTCDNSAPDTNASGQCTIVVNSAVVGSSTVHAAATVTVGGVPIAVATNGYGAFTVSNVKNWVNARISIVQSGTNKVGDAHTFTVTVEADNGGGFVGVPGVTVTPSETGVGTITGGTCTGGGVTDVNGQCTIVVNSATPGQSTVNAMATVMVGGVPIVLSTDGFGAHTVSNVKTWVDARISIVQTGTNKVGDPHTFTVTVESNNGSGWSPVENANVLGSITGVGSITGGTCDNAGGDTNASGQCTIVVNSATPGAGTVNASSTVSVGGIDIAVATNGYGAFTVSNVKTWVDARISIVQTGTNKVNDPHTFTVTVEVNDGTGWAPATSISGGAINIAPTGGLTGGTCLGFTVDANGQCTIVVNSATPGTGTVNMATSVTVGGVSIAVATNGYGAFTVSNVKTWVDARISITQTGTNKVGDAHTFTVTVEANNGSGWAPAVGVAVNPSETGVGAITGGTCDNSAPDTNASGQCTIVVNSATPGSSTVHASSTVTVGGVPIAVATNGYGAFTVSNVKTWVDARISIVQTGTNKVGDPHTFTVTVESNNGSGWTPVENANVLASETGVGAITGGTCDNAGGDTNASGQCTIVVNSATPGQSTVNASSTVTVGGFPIAVATDGYGAFTVSNVKSWVDARISITQTGTNKVGDPHTFTVTVEQNDGTGWAPAVGVAVNPSETGVGGITGGTCDNSAPDTNASGQCTIIVNSATPGQSTVHASATVTVGGFPIAVATDGYGAFTVANVKTWVDARISIQTSGTNGITEAHTFTVTVESNDGSGWAPVSGATVNSTETGVGAITSGSCGPTGPTNASGQCTVVVNSSSAGASTVHASSSVSVGGINVAVATDGYGAFTVSNVKTWVDGSLRWLKHDGNGQLLGGATFEVCRTHDRFGTDITDVCVTVLDNSAPDADADAGEFQLNNLVLGRYTITETVAPTGFTLDPTVETIELTLANPNQTASHIWVNQGAGEGCTPGYWKNHTSAWDQLSDPAVQAMPAALRFTTTTKFNAYFGLTAQQSGFNDNFTMLDAVNANGGGKNKLARHGVSGLLNVNSVNYPIPPSIDTGADNFTDLYNALKQAFLTKTYEPLATQIAANNDLDHQSCPA